MLIPSNSRVLAWLRISEWAVKAQIPSALSESII